MATDLRGASAPLFSVIVPTYHRNESLARCLDCLAPGAQTLTRGQYEVIVTDDGSRTTAEQLVAERYEWTKWVAGPRKGPAANRNNGSNYAIGDWLVFVDDDCLPDRRWLEAYLEAIKASPECSVFEGRVYVDRPKRSLAETSPLVENGGYLISANVACRKDLFSALGGYDERFPYAAMEDVDFGVRLLKAGHRFLFSRAAAVCHPWRKKGGWKSLKRNQKSTFIFLSLHPEERSRINPQMVFRMGLKILVNDTIPGIYRFKGRGIWKAILEHLSIIQGACLLLTNYGQRPDPQFNFKDNHTK